MMKGVLSGQNLGASYDGRPVFRGASIMLGQGTYALQGRNGIGKSTLLRLLAGAQPPDTGDVWIDGESLTTAPLTARRSLSYVPDESPVYPFMTGKELLDFVALTKGAEIGTDAKQRIEDFALSDQLRMRFDAMSLGTQKKMLLSAAWIGAPRVMLMDEPSNGLDQSSRERLATAIRGWKSRGTILFASHDSDFITATDASIVTMETLIADAGAPVTVP
jgi:ABC-2 type transport system ATP-binding protein